MAVGAGVGASLGVFTEAAFNTFPTSITTSKFYEFNSENLKYNKNTKEGMGLRGGGTVTRSQRRLLVTSDASGDFEIDLATRGIGLMLAYSMSNAVSPTTVTTGVYQYQFTFGDPTGDMFSTQVQIPQYGGTVTTKTLTGCKVSSFELGVSNGDIAKGKFMIDAAGFNTTQSTQSASYTPSSASSLFTFAGASFKIAGNTVTNVRDFTLNVDNALKTDRYNMVATGVKSEQVVNGFRKVTGKMTLEFSDTVALAAFVADTTTSLELNLKGDLISGTNYQNLNILLPACKFDADTPNVSGPGPIDLSVTFTAYDNGTNEPLTITYITADSTL